MSRGREAARAATRRAQEAEADAQQARDELAAERAERKTEVGAFRDEIKQLKSDRLAEAASMAATEVTRQLAQAEAERRAKGMSDDIARNLLYLKDKFTYNACRYLSMTTGAKPQHALELVMTWMTDEDFYGFTGPDVLVKLGLPNDGWVARFLRENRHGLRRIRRLRLRNGDPAAVNLDRALADGNANIHPAFDPRWYPPVEYRAVIELLDKSA